MHARTHARTYACAAVCARTKAGNLTFFAGPETFNGYTNFVREHGAVKTTVEYYLLLSFVLHVGVALFRSYKTKVCNRKPAE